MLTTGLRQYLIEANVNAIKWTFNPIETAMHRCQLCTYCLQVRCDEILNYLAYIVNCSHNAS